MSIYYSVSSLIYRVSYLGVIPNSDVASTLSVYDAFVLPSFGENFGHVIYEALSSGLPVFLSNNTPWSSQDSPSIHTFPLASSDVFLSMLRSFYNLTLESRLNLSLSALEFADIILD